METEAQKLYQTLQDLPRKKDLGAEIKKRLQRGPDVRADNGDDYLYVWKMSDGSVLAYHFGPGGNEIATGLSGFSEEAHTLFGDEPGFPWGLPEEGEGEESEGEDEEEDEEGEDEGGEE